eukprot:388384_1
MIITTHFYARNRSHIGLSDETRASGAKGNNAAKIRQFHHGKAHTKSLRNGSTFVIGGNAQFDDVLARYSCKNRGIVCSFIYGQISVIVLFAKNVDFDAQTERQEAQKATHINKPRAIPCMNHKVLLLWTIWKQSRSIQNMKLVCWFGRYLDLELW